MKRSTVWLSETQVHRLRALASKTGLPVAELLRRFIDAGLDQESEPYFELRGSGGQPVALLRGYSLGDLRLLLGRGRPEQENVWFQHASRKPRKGKRRK